MQSYLEVAVADPSYHGKDTLTYKSDTDIRVGSLVLVPLRNKEVLAIVTATTEEPAFTVKAITGLVDETPLPSQLIELISWMRSYYASSLGATAQLLVPSRIVATPALETFNKPIADSLPQLTEEQTSALKSIQKPGMYILHGDTGSGKTRVYIELARKAITQQKSAIILSPEIGLTSQLAYNFDQVFGNRVFILHSQLKESVRREIWSTILRTTEPVVIIGARSALFAPVRNLGLIVIDEAHETAYKQDQAPHYHATRVASKLAEFHKATIILGSATPLVSDYYLAKQKQRPIVRMKNNAVNQDYSRRKLRIVDLRDPSLLSKRTHLSSTLIEAITATLSKQEQVLLFLNRRGTARVVICNSCGWQAICPKCDISLTYHGDLHAIRCHSCNYRAAPPNSCPQCGNVEVILKSVGTKAVTDDINSLFPEAKVMRFDTDNKKEERIEKHYEDMRSGNIDILVGTQTIAKGLDLPKLGLVGVVIADTGLYFPDFSAQERTYQLLYQVVGRIGRGHRRGQAIIQTYLPENAVIRQALDNEWDNFYNNEIAERRQFLFPPFCHLLKLTCKRASSKAAQNAAQKLTDELRERRLKIIVEGPSPCFHERVNNRYCWQVVVKAKERSQLISVIDSLPSGWSFDIDPTNLL